MYRAVLLASILSIAKTEPIFKNWASLRWSIPLIIFNSESKLKGQYNKTRKYSILHLQPQIRFVGREFIIKRDTKSAGVEATTYDAIKRRFYVVIV